MRILLGNKRHDLRALISAGLRQAEEHRWLIIVLSITLVISFLVVTFTVQLGTFVFRTKPHEFEADTVAKRDFIIEEDILFLDEKSTALRREAMENLVPAVFQVNDEIITRVLQKFDRFRSAFLENLEAELTKEQFYLKIQLSVPGVISQDDFEILLSLSDAEGVFAASRLLLEELLNEGIVVIPEEIEVYLTSGFVEVWRWKNGMFEPEERALSAVITNERIKGWIDNRKIDLALEEPVGQSVSLLVSSFAEENAFFGRSQTERKRQSARDSVEPVIEKLVEGQIIVRKGDIVSADAAAKIKALGEYSISVNLHSITSIALFLSILAILSLYLMNKRTMGIALRRKQILFLIGMSVLYICLIAFLLKTVQLADWIPFAVVLPTGVIAILATILVSTREGILLTVVMSLVLLLMTKMDTYTFLFALLSGVAGTAVVQNAERRIDLIRAGLYLSILNVLFLSAIGFFLNYQPREFFTVFLWGIGNGFFCGISSLGFLPLLEHLMNAPTRFVLIELSDLNSPILKRMLSFAPGTYNHSIIVGNLAESACTGIKANALLARVGSYYHDIGKIDQAEYFVENQRSANKHDELKPSLSAAVIKSHVKIGIEKGKELRLPQEILDVIAQHHGKTLIKYFYQRAIDNDGGENKISRNDYTYPGSRPTSKEAAVVMLADTVEAASRTLKKPTIAKLEKLVWNAVMEKFNSGELSESNLTLMDLDVIKKNFVQVLAGHFHSRIEYPKIKELVN